MSATDRAAQRWTSLDFHFPEWRKRGPGSQRPGADFT